MSENPIKKRRKAQGLSQQQLAERVTCSRSFIAQLENGVRLGSRKTLHKLAAALGCPVSELLEEPSAAQVKAPGAAQSRSVRRQRPPVPAIAGPKLIREFERLQDRRRQLVADLGVVDARLETLLRVV